MTVHVIMVSDLFLVISLQNFLLSLQFDEVAGAVTGVFGLEGTSNNHEWQVSSNTDLIPFLYVDVLEYTEEKTLVAECLEIPVIVEAETSTFDHIED